MTDAIHYNELIRRAADVAGELLENTDSADNARDLVAESCEWDWVIYYSKAMDLCTNVPSDILDDAESMVADCCMVNEKTDLYSHACAVAFWIVHNAVSEQLEQLINETVEVI